VLVQAKAWRNQEETEPAGIDYAFGYREAYNPNMKRWFVEDTVTSALMRVMALVMGGTEKATKETMEQVKVTMQQSRLSMITGQPNLVMCQATKQPLKLSKLASHHLDHRWMRLPSNWVESLYKRHRNAHMAIACFAPAHRPKQAKSGRIGHVLAKNPINVSRCGWYSQAVANGSHKYERLHVEIMYPQSMTAKLYVQWRDC
jgi:hypothetical protein